MKSNEGCRYLLDFLEELYPDKLPIKQVSDFELGIKVGQRQLIENLKIKLDLVDEKEMINK